MIPFRHPLFLLCFLLLLNLFFPSSVYALNITKILSRHPDFSSFNGYLSQTHLPDSINVIHNGITVLAVDNTALGTEISAEIEHVLRLHLLRGYYTPRRLHKLLSNGSGSSRLPTLDRRSFVGVRVLENGGIGFNGGSGLSSQLVKPIFTHSGLISVLQITNLIKPQSSSLGTCTFCPSARSKKNDALPIDTVFKLPSPLPNWPPGRGFAKGTIDVGGLVVQQITSFTKVWATHEGGPDNLGATFFEPSAPLPNGYFMLGSYAQPNNKPLYGGVLVGKDTSDRALQKPIDYSLLWSSDSVKINQEGIAYIWLPIPPDGYRAVGHVITTTPQKPSLDKVRCVVSDLTDQCEADTWIWGNGNAVNVFGSRPSVRGTGASGFSTGSFAAQTANPGSGSDSGSGSLSCLKNTKYQDMSSMPNLDQIKALVQIYAPTIYFHPDEAFLPASVSWFFSNGALLYQKGQEPNPVFVHPTGSNLPKGGSSDGSYWLDLPSDGGAKDRVKKGDVQSAEAYLHVKPMLGGTFTDIAMWVFYPFNGPARAKIKFVNLALGRIGEHVGDWEHITLRINNFNGQLWSVYLAEHGAGIWVSAPELEYLGGTANSRFVAYSSLHGHASYHHAGMFLQGNDGVGVRNDFARSNMFLDTAANFSIVSAEYLGSSIIEPPWLNYCREWGPKLDYDAAQELEKVIKVLPGKLKTAFRSIVQSLPDEVLKEEGPIGPKMKGTWTGDEEYE